MSASERTPPASSTRRDLLLFTLAWIVYLPMLGRGFASEDFVILRRLAEGSLVENLLAQFTGPWLRLAGIGFYRPVSTALLGLEIAAFGQVAWPYLLVHGGIHALNTVLVARLIQALLGPKARRAAGFAGLLFALHPLSLNAVAFIASFATLFGMTFALLALLAWARWRAEGGGGRLAVALGSFALALGSYELAAVLPGLVILADLLAPGLPRAPWTERLLSWASGMGLLGVYLLGRHALFGRVLGGYPETASLIARIDLGARIPEAARALAYLVVPVEAETLSVTLGLWLAAIACFGPLLLATLRGAAERREAARVAVLGLLWALAALAPFGVVRLVPGNGRYGYLALVGCVIALSRAADSVEAILGRLSGLAFRGALLVGCAGLFLSLGRAHLQSAQIVAAARADLVEKAGDGLSPILCSDYPLFVTSPGGAPQAQVYHYGLSDSVRPPFGPLSVEVLPLTTGVVRDAAPLLRALPDARLFRWRPESRRFDRVSGASEGAGVYELAVEGMETGASWPAPPGRSGWAVASLDAANRCDVVVAALGNATRLPGRQHGTSCAGEIPRDFVDTQVRLYGGRAYWWIELFSASGKLLASSTARRLELGEGPAGGAR